MCKAFDYNINMKKNNRAYGRLIISGILNLLIALIYTGIAGYLLYWTKEFSKGLTELPSSSWLLSLVAVLLPLAIVVLFGFICILIFLAVMQLLVSIALFKCAILSPYEVLQKQKRLRWSGILDVIFALFMLPFIFDDILSAVFVFLVCAIAASHLIAFLLKWSAASSVGKDKKALDEEYIDTVNNSRSGIPVRSRYTDLKYMKDRGQISENKYRKLKRKRKKSNFKYHATINLNIIIDAVIFVILLMFIRYDGESERIAIYLCTAITLALAGLMFSFSRRHIDFILEKKHYVFILALIQIIPLALFIIIIFNGFVPSVCYLALFSLISVIFKFITCGVLAKGKKQIRAAENASGRNQPKRFY